MAVLFCVLCAFSQTLSNVIMKKLTNVGPLTIVAGKFFVTLLITLPIVAHR